MAGQAGMVYKSGQWRPVANTAISARQAWQNEGRRITDKPTITASQARAGDILLARGGYGYEIKSVGKNRITVRPMFSQDRSVRNLTKWEREKAQFWPVSRGELAGFVALGRAMRRTR